MPCLTLAEVGVAAHRLQLPCPSCHSLAELTLLVQAACRACDEATHAMQATGEAIQNQNVVDATSSSSVTAWRAGQVRV